MQGNIQKDSDTSDSPRVSTSSSDRDTMSKAKMAANQEDPYNVSNDSVLKETEMTHKGIDMENPATKSV